MFYTSGTSKLKYLASVVRVYQQNISDNNSIHIFILKHLPKITCLYPKDCDIQLFSPSGVFENPTTSNTNHTCRVLINAPPAVKIQIQAIHIAVNSSDSESTYIMVHTRYSTLLLFYSAYPALLGKSWSDCSPALSFSDPRH